MIHARSILFIALLVVAANSYADAQEHPIADASAAPEPETEQKDQSNGTGQTELPRPAGASLSLKQYGVTLSTLVKNDFLNVLHGGIDRGPHSIFNADLMLNADLSQSFGAPDLKLFVHVLGNNGGSINGSVGEFQMVSNIEAYRTLKLYQCWFEQSISSAQLSILFGIFDMNSEFYVTPTSALFLNGSQGVGTDLGQTGLNGPSIFPNTALAFRVRCFPTENISVSAAVFDGLPGSPQNRNSFDLSVNSRDGYFAISEAAYELPGTAKYGAGVWLYTGSYADLYSVDGPVKYFERNDNAGFYLLFDQSIYKEPGSNNEGLSIFTRFGMTNDHVNIVQYHCGAGATYTGLIDGRNEDRIGIAAAYASFGKDFRRLNSFHGVSTASCELVHEITYQSRIFPWLALQLNMQYILHPSASTDIGNPLIAGIRTEIAL